MRDRRWLRPVRPVRPVRSVRPAPSVRPVRPGRPALPVLTALATLAAIVAYLSTAFALAPRDEGVEASWESPGPPGRVIDTAWVATDENVAVDLTTGMTITLGSVTGGEQFVGGQRFIIVTDSSVEAAALNGHLRWTVDLEPGERATALAATREATILQRCTDTCRLDAIGTSGQSMWTLPIRAGQALPAPAAVLPQIVAINRPAGVLLIDPATTRELPINDARAHAAPGQVTLTYPRDAACVIATYRTLDDSTTTTTTPDVCAQDSPETLPHSDLPDSAAPATTSRAGWWPFRRAVANIPVPGQDPVTITGGSVEVLRVTEEQITVRRDDTIRGYDVEP